MITLKKNDVDAIKRSLATYGKGAPELLAEYLGRIGLTLPACDCGNCGRRPHIHKRTCPRSAWERGLKA